MSPPPTRPPAQQDKKAASGRRDETRTTALPRLGLLLLLLLLLFMFRCQVAEGGTQDEPRPRAQTSELTFEYLGLRSVPSEQFCSPIGAINALSLAYNQIGSLEASAFRCVGAKLRILNLGHNQIELISWRAFEGLHELQVLLLDANKITQIPGQTFLPLSSLRHLNLAQNQLDSIGPTTTRSNSSLDLDLNFAQSNQLISLSVRQNPLGHLQPGSFRRLSKLKTLILSQTSLLSKMASQDGPSNEEQPLAGLDELRFLHLDELEVRTNSNPSAGERSKLLRKLLPIDFCAHSARRLTSLTLRGNALDEIPKFSNCSTLLQIDLSHNNLAGPLNNQSFVGLANLLDLYLGFNGINYIHADAFAGLTSLQVLRLNNNQLKGIHPGALRPFGRSLLELDVARNELLAELPIGEPLSGQLRSLRANGNYHLRQLTFRLGPQASSMALTYAYHCCDYLADAKHLHTSNNNKSFLVRLLASLLGRWLNSEEPNLAAKSNQEQTDDQQQADLKNVTESVLVWRPNLTEAQTEMRRWHSKRHLIDDLDVMGRIRNLDSKPPDYFASLISLDGHRGQTDRDKDRNKNTDTNIGRLSRRQVDGTTTTTTTACLPQPNPFQPCRDLFDSWWLRAAIWFVFLFAFSGNILVLLVLGSVKSSSSHSALTSIMWLQGGHSKRHIDVPRFLVLNLAFADLLMSLYLGLLAFVDLSTLGDFRSYAVRWQHSSGCQLAGFLAVLSSELSVFILAIITLERNYAITNAVHLNRRLSLQKAMFIMLLGYLFALGMALMPLNGVSDYRKFSICLPLDLGSTTTGDTQHDDHFNNHHQAYLVTLISINSVSFLLLFGCYLRMYCAIRGSQAWNTNDLRIAKRMSILVVTDFLCWVPIIAVSAGSLFDYHLVSLEGLKVITVFVLPLNSVANPFLYAITTKKFKRDLTVLRKRLVSLLSVRWLNGSQQHGNHHHQALAKRHLTLRDNSKAVVVTTNNKQRTTKDLLGENNDLMVSIRKAQKQVQQANKTNKMTQVTNYNQVTLNRTTTQCSCQLARANQAASNSNVAHRQAERIVRTKNIRVQLDGSSSLVDQTTGRGPQVAPSDSSSSSTSRLTIHPKIVLDIIEPALDVALAPLGLGLVEVAGRPEVSDQNNNNSTRRAHKDELSVNVEVERNADHSPSSLSSQPASEPTGDRHLFVCSQTELTKCCKNNQSCQTIIQTNKDTLEANVETVRSASACGYRTPRRHQDDSTPRNRQVNKNNNSSCGQLENRSRLSRSIQRLLFSPIARTWSSIQTSLQSVNSLKQTEAVVVVNADANQDRRTHHQVDELDDSPETTLEDILQLSSPARRRMLRNHNQRRMSRSCELPGPDSSGVATSDKRQSIISNTTTSKSSSSQHDDLFDDSRILLATINRMARGGRVGANFGGLVKQTGATRTARKCHRCRSWSPALLDKLEDCMYQLKSRMPGFGGNGASSQLRHEAMQSSSDLSADQADQKEDDDDEEEEEQEDEEDDFNEMGLLEWNRQKTTTTTGQFRPSRHRLRQQSSTNSDTLSTRTAATVMTNMSVSFDSNTNIPTTTTTTPATRPPD